HRVPQMMVGAMQSYITSPLMFMLLVNILLLIVGCLMTTGEAILVLAPLLAPIAESYDYDKVIFWLIMMLILEICYMTPPVNSIRSFRRHARSARGAQFRVRPAGVSRRAGGHRQARRGRRQLPRADANRRRQVAVLPVAGAAS